jgi:hypothetical protein
MGEEGMKPKWLDRTLIANPYYYTLCTTPKMFAKEMKRLGIENPPRFILNDHSDASVHWFEKDGGLCAVINIREHKDKHQIYALLIHEAVHIWQEIRINIGESAPSKEFEAYAIQRISMELFDEYKRQTK